MLKKGLQASASMTNRPPKAGKGKAKSDAAEVPQTATSELPLPNDQETDKLTFRARKVVSQSSKEVRSSIPLMEVDKNAVMVEQQVTSPATSSLPQNHHDEGQGSVGVGINGVAREKGDNEVSPDPPSSLANEIVQVNSLASNKGPFSHV